MDENVIDLINTMRNYKEEYNLTEDNIVNVFLSVVNCLGWDVEEFNDNWSDEQLKNYTKQLIFNGGNLTVTN